MTQIFSRTVRINRSVEEVFSWHENAAALPRLTPPWERVEVVSQSGGIQDGARVVVRSKVGPIWTTWAMEHFGYDKGRLFCDRQLAGPFNSWVHFHRFAPISDDVCELTDEIHYTLPFGLLGQVGAAFTRGKLERMFAYRHAVTKADLELPKAPVGRVVVSGASGLIGSALVPFLRTQGWTVDRLVRDKARQPDEIEWNLSAGIVHWPDGYAPDAVIHLAGANVAGGRWTPRRRKAIMQSRIEGTRTLAKAIGELETPPRVWLSGSATGFYGNRGGTELKESSPSGSGFLADVCQAWEKEADAQSGRGVRVVKLRTGIVLSPAGGALAKMLPAFQAGVGGALGDGRQWMSWIGIEDWMRACLFLLNSKGVAGPVNLVAPSAVQNGVFTRVLGARLQRPAILPVPAAVLVMLFGQMAEEALLSSARVVPGVLTQAGFKFLHPELENALGYVLGKPV
jgi:uncharacterized protein (TIGR01777 family)